MFEVVEKLKLLEKWAYCSCVNNVPKKDIVQA
jgi:hypothetical protein